MLGELKGIATRNSKWQPTLHRTIQCSHVHAKDVLISRTEQLRSIGGRFPFSLLLLLLLRKFE